MLRIINISIPSHQYWEFNRKDKVLIVTAWIENLKEVFKIFDLQKQTNLTEEDIIADLISLEKE